MAKYDKYCNKCGCYIPVGETTCIACGASIYAINDADKLYNNSSIYSLDAAMQVISDNTHPPKKVVEYVTENIYDTLGREVLTLSKTYTYDVQKVAIPKPANPFACITSSSHLDEAHDKGYIYVYTNDTNKMYIWANGQWVQIAS